MRTSPYRMSSFTTHATEPIPPARSEHYTHPPSPLQVIDLASTCGRFLDVDPLHLCLLRPYVLSRRAGRRHEGPVRTVTCDYRVNLIVCGLEGGRWGMGDGSSL